MSGFVVMLRHDGGAVTRDSLDRVIAPLLARGPDDTAVWLSPSLGVASTLLDTGDARLRPRTAHAGEHVVTGQVRLDGRSDLVSRLRAAARHVSDADADIALFAQAWDAWGAGAFDRIIGDFSVVVVNQATRACTLARDPFGVRMLFYSATPDRLVASNTLAAVRAAEGVSDALDEDALADFMAVGLNENLAGTTFRDIRRVPPGSFIQFIPGRPSGTTRYWRLPELGVAPSGGDYAERFRAVLEDSVRDRCRGGPVTVSMSGGLDSTSLAVLARRVLPASASVTALTIDLPTIAPSPDAARARIVAQRSGLLHVEFDGDQYGYREGTNDELFHTPEPSDEPDILIWRAFLLEAAASSRVMLYGEDPDALLTPPDLHEQFRARSAWRVGWSILGYLLHERSRPHLGLRDSVRRVAAGHRTLLPADAGPPWLRADLRARRAERLAERAAVTHATRGEMARRLAHPLWQATLESLDAGQHGVPVDVRLPFLDVRVVESALAAPAIPWLQRKRLLREAMRGLLPEAVRTAPKRGLPGLYEGRVRQWWSRHPQPFVPSEQLAAVLHRSAIPVVTPASDALDVLAHLRLRILDRWLRTLS